MAGERVDAADAGRPGRAVACSNRAYQAMCGHGSGDRERRGRGRRPPSRASCRGCPGRGTRCSSWSSRSRRAFTERRRRWPLRELAETRRRPLVAGRWRCRCWPRSRRTRATSTSSASCCAPRTGVPELGERFGLGMVLYSRSASWRTSRASTTRRRPRSTRPIALATELGNDEDLPQFIGWPRDGRRPARRRRGGPRAARARGGATGARRTAAIAARAGRRSSGWRATSRGPRASSRSSTPRCSRPTRSRSACRSARPTSPCCARRWSSRRATRRRPGRCCRPAAEPAVTSRDGPVRRHGGRGGCPARASPRATTTPPSSCSAPPSRGAARSTTAAPRSSRCWPRWARTPRTRRRRRAPRRRRHHQRVPPLTRRPPG